MSTSYLVKSCKNIYPGHGFTYRLQQVAWEGDVTTVKELITYLYKYWGKDFRIADYT